MTTAATLHALTTHEEGFFKLAFYMKKSEVIQRFKDAYIGEDEELIRRLETIKPRNPSELKHAKPAQIQAEIAVRAVSNWQREIIYRTISITQKSAEAWMIKQTAHAMKEDHLRENIQNTLADSVSTAMSKLPKHNNLEMKARSYIERTTMREMR